MHKFPIGSLVETKEGLRLWVVEHTRGSYDIPLYTISFTIDFVKLTNLIPSMSASAITKCLESELTLIK